MTEDVTLDEWHMIMHNKMRRNSELAKENLMSNRAEKWKKIAKDLSEALRRCSWQCTELGHQKGQFHSHDEECPVRLQIGNAFDAYNEKLAQEKQTL